MTLEEEIVQWINTRHNWQKDVMARIGAGEIINQNDIEEIADTLVANNFDATLELGSDDLQLPSAKAEPVSLNEVSHIGGINALPPGEKLRFSHSGLTIVYGDNASGKSGFARMLREAVSSRVKGRLLGNVYSEEQAAQEVELEFRVGNEAEPQTWTLGQAPHGDLASVRFYDRECGQAYVTTASEISYRPSALALLDQLDAACVLVGEELERRIQGIDQEKGDLPAVHEGTTAERFLTRLAHDTPEQSLDEMCSLPADHEVELSEALTEEARLKGSSPTDEKARLAALATHWTTVQKYAKTTLQTLSTDSLKTLGEQLSSASTLREAAAAASALSFDSEPLSGIGSGAWRRLWDAARLYSVAHAYPDYDFPHTDEGAHCVLCQQPLLEDGRDRLQRFHDYMSASTEREAAEAEAQLRARQQEIESHVQAASDVGAALSDLRAGGEAVEDVEEWLRRSSDTARQAIVWLEGNDDSPPAGLDDPVDAIVARTDELQESSKAIDDSGFAESLSSVSANVRELQARSALASAKSELKAELARLKRRNEASACLKHADTTGVTRKKTELTKRHVTGRVRDRFTKEARTLKVQQVTLDPTRGRKQVSLEHQPRLADAKQKAAISSVLSEGEQTAIGLAGFFTEVEFDSSRSAIVFDDPVTSLDATRRSRVARRLTELARDRQVIVFTHEATFVHALVKCAADLGVEVVDRSVIQVGHTPGKVRESYPWGVKDTKQRIHTLSVELDRIKRERPNLDSDEYRTIVGAWAGKLSEAWERSISLDIVSEILDPGSGEVRPRMVRLLSRVTEDDDRDFQAGYGQISEWVTRHDKSPSTNYVPPEPDELEAELERFKEWVGRVRTYKK